MYLWAWHTIHKKSDLYFFFSRMKRRFFCFVHPIFSSFGILVTFVAWFSFHFFPSCPSYLAKCKQRLRNIFVTWSPKVTKNKKRKMRWTKHIWVYQFFEISVLDMQNGKFKIKCSFSQKYLRNWKSCTEWLEILNTYLKLVVKFRYSEKVTIILKNSPALFYLLRKVWTYSNFVAFSKYLTCKGNIFWPKKIIW